MKPSLNEAEESIALELALSSRNTQILRCRPISVDDIIDTLMVNILFYRMKFSKFQISPVHEQTFQPKIEN